MKNILTIFSLVALVSCAYTAEAQLSKAEAKEWKKRIKSLTPEQYKDLLGENKAMKTQLIGLKKEVAGTDDRIQEKDNQISDYQDQLSSLRRELSDAKKNAKRTGGGGGNMATKLSPEKGVVFKVQIGAFKKKDLKKFAQDNPAFHVETKSGLMKYTIGVFRDYWESDTFKKYLREIGVKDAWIVAFKDGARVPIKQVLEGGS